MIDLNTRSYQPELLDGDDIPFEDIRRNMRELDIINTYLGGHAISVSGIKKILNAVQKKQPVVICEIGCGGGDNLAAINRWLKKNRISASFIGIDIKAACIEFAKQQYPDLDAEWIISDYAKTEFGGHRPDIIFSSLFCHHFRQAALVQMLQWLQRNSVHGFFINDLHRHPLAYHSIKLITGIFSRSRLVKNDAPLSVARGFTRKEWQGLIEEAGIANCEVQWKWAFRHLVTHVAQPNNFAS